MYRFLCTLYVKIYVDTNPMRKVLQSLAAICDFEEMTKRTSVKGSLTARNEQANNELKSQSISSVELILCQPGRLLLIQINHLELGEIKESIGKGRNVSANSVLAHTKSLWWLIHSVRISSLLLLYFNDITILNLIGFMFSQTYKFNTCRESPSKTRKPAVSFSNYTLGNTRERKHIWFKTCYSHML